MTQVQHFIGVSEYIKEENFVLNEDRGMYCLQLSDAQAGDDEPCFIAGTKGRTSDKHLDPVVNRKLHQFFEPFDDHLAKQIQHDKFDWNY